MPGPVFRQGQGASVPPVVWPRAPRPTVPPGFPAPVGMRPPIAGGPPGHLVSADAGPSHSEGTAQRPSAAAPAPPPGPKQGRPNWEPAHATQGKNSDWNTVSYRRRSGGDKGRRGPNTASTHPGAGEGHRRLDPPYTGLGTRAQKGPSKGHREGPNPPSGQVGTQQAAPAPSRHKSKRAKKSREQPCPVDGCSLRTSRFRRHVYIHFPGCYRPTPGQAERLATRRVQGLHYLAQVLARRRGGSIQGLVRLVNGEWRTKHGLVCDELDEDMRAMCRHMGWPEKPRFTIRPLNSPACLIHPRVLAFLFNRLTKAQRTAFEAEARTIPAAQGAPPPEGGAGAGSSSGGPDNANTPMAAAPPTRPLDRPGDPPSEHVEAEAEAVPGEFPPEEPMDVSGPLDPMVSAVAPPPLEHSTDECQAPAPVAPPLEAPEAEGATPSLSVTPPVLGNTEVKEEEVPSSSKVPPSSGSRQAEKGGQAASGSAPPPTAGTAKPRPRQVLQRAVNQLGRTSSPGRKTTGQVPPPRPSVDRTDPQRPGKRSTQKSVPAPIQVVDSHAHLDRLERDMGQSGMECLTAITGKKPQVTVKVAGGVINYCDPSRFSSILFPPSQNWRVAVGIHPKHASEVSDADIKHLGELLRYQAVVGVSEVGLDHSVSAARYKAQTKLLQDILSLPYISQKVLVVHLRGNRNDPMGQAVHSLCRDYLRLRCGQAQWIHLHCTTTGPSVVKDWLRQFPETYFGFTALVDTFGEQQRQGLREVPLDRLLLETDAPYMPPPSARGHPSTSAYLGETADLVAQIRGVSVPEVCRATAANAARLYSLHLEGNV